MNVSILDIESVEVPISQSETRNATPEPSIVFKDKKEAMEAFKELLKEKVSQNKNWMHLFLYLTVFV